MICTNSCTVSAGRQGFRCRCQQRPDPKSSVPKGSIPQSPVTRQGPQTPQNNQTGFGSVERMIATTFNNVQPGLRTDWTEVEGNWLLRPLQGSATAVVHFLGGAFVGAAPQLTYRLLLESLAARGIMVQHLLLMAIAFVPKKLDATLHYADLGGPPQSQCSDWFPTLLSLQRDCPYKE